MNLKVKAALQVTSMLAGACGAAVLVDNLIKNFSPETIVGGLGCGVMVFIVYQLYQIRLSQLEYQADTERRIKGQ